MEFLPVDHFLNLPRPDVAHGVPADVIDTSTLAAHDFDVDTRTGFMPPQEPLRRLPDAWEPWEEALDRATQSKLQLGASNPSLESQAQSEAWRASIREMATLPTADLGRSEILLRRAHKVLAWLMHFYIHSLPPSAPVVIPAPITIPLLQICAQLQLPPVLTYSDDVLYNWAPIRPIPATSADPAPALDNLRCQTLFTGTPDEQEFYLASARMELRGVEALALMRATMDETFVGDALAVRRVAAYLRRIARVVRALERLLLAVRDGCDPDVFFHVVRPWNAGADSDPARRPWVFDGLAAHPELKAPTELSGASAGQSALIHALDVFLGVDKYSHAPTGHADPDRPSFLTRMQAYMPRHHRAFLNHLANTPRPLREFVAAAADAELQEAYNGAVLSLKELRDSHMKIVALYIIGPASRARAQAREAAGISPDAGPPEEPLKGTGGSDLAKFLKEVRDRTAGAVLPDSDETQPF